MWSPSFFSFFERKQPIRRLFCGDMRPPRHVGVVEARAPHSLFAGIELRQVGSAHPRRQCRVLPRIGLGRLMPVSSTTTEESCGVLADIRHRTAVL
ncbi:hypothetical protein NDU88_002177 [Pleurodeles waltl]|uniref:Uncharacterized protein n=1 Tax=Pleurodeles waltl TaxID=8319 RepID=A0AAV7UAH7_PLEWA|nr:hypothetical protein NDU88_002177 [Pleurodeles waltl]